MRSRKLKMDIQYNGQKKRLSNNLHNTIQKTKDRATRTSLRTGDELMCSGSIRYSCSTCGTRRVTLVKSVFGASTTKSKLGINKMCFGQEYINYKLGKDQLYFHKFTDN